MKMTFKSILFLVVKLGSFISVQYLFGKKASYPYGLLLGFDLFEITLLVIACDIAETAFLLQIFHFSGERVKWLNKIHSLLIKKETEPSKSKIRERLMRYRKLGVFFVSILPYAGGAISGSILSYSLGLKKKESFFIIVLGCIVGAGIFYLGFSGFFAIIKNL